MARVIDPKNGRHYNSGSNNKVRDRGVREHHAIHHHITLLPVNAVVITSGRFTRLVTAAVVTVINIIKLLIIPIIPPFAVLLGCSESL